MTGAQRRRREDRLVAAIQIGIVLLLAAGWETASRLRWIDPELLPPLSKVTAMLWQMLQQPDFLVHVRVTLSEIAVAFAIVVPFGLLLGFLIGERRWLYQMLNPSLQLMMATPKAIFLPIFIIAFGIGFVEKVLFATMLGIFAVMLSGITAVHSVPQGLVTATRSMGASRSQIYLQIYLPAMLPLIIGGLRIGLIFTIFGVLLGEMYAASKGIGLQIFDWGEAFQMPQLLACVLLVVIITIVLNELLRSCERLSGRARRSRA